MLLSTYLPHPASYAVYIAILIFYFCFIFFMFPETKRLSAEEASKVFDFSRKGVSLDKTVNVEDGDVSVQNDKKASHSMVENR